MKTSPPMFILKATSALRPRITLPAACRWRCRHARRPGAGTDF